MITALKTMAKILGDTSNIYGGTSGALQYGFNDSVTNAFGTPPKAAIVFEADFVSGVILSSTKSKAGTGFNVVPFPSITPGPDSTAVEISGDLFVTFRDNPAIEAFVKFLATPAAANAWAKEGGFATGNHNVSLARVSRTRSTAPTSRPSARRSQVVFDMSDEQPAAFGSTTGQGEWGLFQTFLKNPSNATGIAKQLESGGRGGLQEGQVTRLERGRDHGGAADRGGSACPAAKPGRLGRYLTGGAFLAPALFLLGVWLVYPTVYTIVRSFFGPSGFLGSWVGIDNYKTLFTTSTLTTAIKNNAIWVAVVPALVTRARADLRRADRAGPLGGRLQDGGLPADGDLGLRDRRHLADHVPAGSRPRGDQRAREDRSPASSARPACSRRRSRRLHTLQTTRVGCARAEDAARAGRRRPARR